MELRSILSATLLAGGIASAATAQEVTPMAPDTASASVATVPSPLGFTSASQARVYLTQNPAGARAEAAFRTIVASEIAARNPDFDPAGIAQGSALEMMPGATATPAEVEAVILQTTPGIGARTGLF